MEHINRIKAAAVGVLGCLTALWGWFGWLVVAWIGCMVLDYATGSAAALRSGSGRPRSPGTACGTSWGLWWPCWWPPFWTG